MSSNFTSPAPAERANLNMAPGASSLRTLRIFYTVRTVCLLAGLVAALLSPGTAHAATFVWDGGGGDNNWTTANNWNPNGAPPGISANNDLLQFAGSTRLTPSNNFAANTQFQLNFASGAGAFTLSGNAITLGGPIINNSGNLQTINLNLVLSASVNLNSSIAGLTIGGNISGSGFGISNKNGSGVLTLSGTNSFTGVTNVSAGTLRAGSTTAFGSNSAVTLSNVASVVLNLNNISVGIGSLAGGGATGGNVSLGTGTLTTGGNNSSTSYAGVISGTGGLTKTGTGTQSLTGASTYTGLTTVSNGTLAYGANNVISTGAVTVNGASAILDLSTFSDSVGTVTLDGGGLITGTAPSALTSTGSFEMKNGTANVALAGPVNLFKTTAGTVILSGAAANTYANNTFVNAGELHLAKSAGNAVNDSALSSLNIGDGVGGANADVVKLLASNQMGDDGGVNILNTGKLDMQSFSDTIYRLDSAAGSTITGAAGSTLTVGSATANSGSGVVDGVIAGGLALVKAGVGEVLELNNIANTYTGNTTVSQGTLDLNNTGTNNNIANSPVIQVDAGAILNVAGLGTGGTDLDLASGQTLGGSGIVQGNVTVGGGIIAPGSSPGVLTINGNQIWDDGDTYEWEVADVGTAGVDYDLTDVNGNLNFSAVSPGGVTLEVIKLAGSGSISDSDDFALWTYNTLTGWLVGTGENNPSNLFDFVLSGVRGTPIVYDDGAGTIWLTGIHTTPEPSSLALGLVSLASLGLFSRRRKR